jgi:hypothetical protein
MSEVPETQNYEGNSPLRGCFPAFPCGRGSHIPYIAQRASPKRHLLTQCIFLCQGAIQLSDAAEHLIGGPCKEGKRQQTRLTVERRLYDIGSILSTLNLIQRTYVEGKRQPAFSWNWQWANNDPRPGTPPSRSEVRPLAEAGSPQAVAVPLFTAPHSAGSPPPAAVGPSALESLPQLTFPGLGGNSQSPLIRTKIMCLPSFPVVGPNFAQTQHFFSTCPVLLSPCARMKA